MSSHNTSKGSDFVSRQEIIEEIDRRIGLLKEHENDSIEITGNQYAELNRALSKVIGVPLMGELTSMKEYIQQM
ncbi:MAG: hypothetical protein ACLU62_13165 [Hydrogeniiclostridium sp.]